MHETKMSERVRNLEDQFDGVTHSLHDIKHQQQHIQTNQEKIMAVLDELTAKVAENTDVNRSAVALLQGLKVKLDACGTDPVKLAELSAALGSNTQALSEAIVANTPVESA